MEKGRRERDGSKGADLPTGHGAPWGRRGDVELRRALDAAHEGDWQSLARLVRHLAGVPLSRLPHDVVEFLLDLVFWCRTTHPGPEAFPSGVRTSGRKGLGFLGVLLAPKIRKAFSTLPPFVEAKTYPLAEVAALGVPVPRPFRKSPGGLLWRRRFRIFRRRFLENLRAESGRNGLPVENEPPCSPVTVSDLSRVWQGGPQRRRLPFRPGRFLRIGRFLGASMRRSALRSPFLPASGMASKGPAGFQYRGVRGSSAVESWGALGSGAVRFLEELVDAVAEELRAVRRLAEGVSRARRRVVLSLHNAASAACSGWAFQDVDRQFVEARAADLFVKNVRDRLIARSLSESAASDDPMLRKLWAAWQERLITPKAVHGLWEAWGRAVLGGPDERDQAARAFQDLFPGTPAEAVAESAPLAWSGWLGPHQHFSWRVVESQRREKKALWSPGFRCLKALLQEGQRRLDAGDAEALVVPWIDKFFISSKREGDLGYLRMLLDWLRMEGLTPIVLFWEDTTRGHEPTLAVALRRRWPASQFTGFGVFGDGPWTRRDAEGILTRTAEPGRLYVLRPLDDTHRPRSVEAVLHGRVDRRDFFAGYDSSWKDGTYAFYTGTQAASLTSIATEPERIPPWVVVRGLRRPLGWYFRRAVRQRALGGDEDERLRPLTVRIYARFANLL
ncbi:hypothetical protein [Desulfosoma sp.]